MDCLHFREQFPMLLNDSLDKPEREELDEHLSGCIECRAELGSVKKVWKLMGDKTLPEPSDSMEAGFNAILSNYKKEAIINKNPVSQLIIKIREELFLRPFPRLAFSVLVLVIGLIAGYLLHRPAESEMAYHRQIDSLSSQVSEVKQLMMLTLLQNPSASERIRAVSYTSEISRVDMKVIDALFTTLNEDPNVNVRLATLEALVKLSYEPEVREGLVRSISKQESPLMQSAIADVMVRLQEKSSVKSLQKLLNDKNLNQMVKLNIEKNIQKLI